MEIKFEKVDFDKVIALYEDAQWSAYLSDRKLLEDAYANSLCVGTAWENEELIGVIRSVGDGTTILYIQDLIVVKHKQRKGVGEALVVALCERYPHVRQKILLCDATKELTSFYHKLSFVAVENYQMQAFIK